MASVQPTGSCPVTARATGGSATQPGGRIERACPDAAASDPAGTTRPAAEPGDAPGPVALPRPYDHEVLGVVLQVRGGRLAVLLWQRGRAPHAGAWALPGGLLRPDEDLDHSLRRQLAAKVDVRELAHLEQLGTRADPERHPARRVLATAYLGIVPADADPAVPPDTAWHPTAALPAIAFDHERFVAAGVQRLRAKLCYTNVGFALAPPSFTMSQLAGEYAAALGYPVTPTNLQRILLRRGQIEPTGKTAPPGRTGGRPATVFRFTARTLEVTDPFAVLHPPTRDG